jgi:hypothetical protein
MMILPELIARSSSRLTASEVFASDEKIRTTILDPLMASIIAAPQLEPGRTSRGAIQQRILWDSSRAQTASATGLFFEE